MFTRKFTTIVLVSLVSIILVLMNGACSDGPSVVTSYSLKTAPGYKAPDWNENGSIFKSQSGTEFFLTQQRRGIVTTDFNLGLDEIITAARQPDGKIVGAGVVTVLGSVHKVGLARYNSNGALDTAFGTGGKVITDFFGTNISRQGASSLVIQPDGKIVVAGMVLPSPSESNQADFGLLRYDADGSLDATFGTGGKVITNVAANKSDVAMTLALQPDGKIVAAGFNGAPMTPQVPSDFVIVRYNSNGSVDTAFGTGGIVITDFNNDVDFASSLVIQPDGKMVVGGWTYNRNNSSYDFALARYDLNGNLDNGFGSGGKIVSDFGSIPNDPRDDILTSMVLQPDGKILAAGIGEPTRNTTSADFAIWRFNSNGSLDTTFGTSGRVATDFNETIDAAYSIALQPDGKFVVAGVANGILQGGLLPQLRVHNNVFFTESPTVSDFAVARYHPNGSLDQSFGTGGRGITDIFGSIDAATKVLILPNGNILALGFAQTTPYLSNEGQNLSKTDFASVMYQGTILQRRKLNDFDGDGKAEFAVYRPTDATWYILNSFNNSFRSVQFGLATDKPVAGDYDGDGLADIAVYRPSNGVWYSLQSSDNTFRAVQFGLSEDKPVPDDYDGDGKTDVAVYRPSEGVWYLLRSNLGFSALRFGLNDDIPVNGDYDGDGKADVAVYRPNNGNWYRLNSSDDTFSVIHFGTAEDKPVVGDYDGDGIYDLAVFRPSNGVWYLLKSHDGFSATQFGLSSDVPVPADYDGDQQTDIVVFRPSNGTWYILKSSDGQFSVVPFGLNSDIPIPGIYVP